MITFEQLTKEITKLTNFDCSLYSQTFLMRRVSVRMRALNKNNYDEYYDELQKSIDERNHLLKEFTIHTTNFFRDKIVWNLIIDEIIPIIKKLKREKKENNIKIWSAGCSTGEEPLSIAIACYESLGALLANYDVEIIATDLDPKTIEFAKKAEYDPIQFNELPAELKNKWFTEENNILKPKNELLKLIKYQNGDILSKIKPKNIDIIFCRNTVIYFDAKTKEQLYQDFYNSMKPGSFFIMGKTETLIGPAKDQFQIFNNKERVYFKE